MMRKLVALGCMMATALSWSTAYAQQDSPRVTPLVKVIQEIEPAVVGLFVRKKDANGGSQFGSGSGVIIHPDGYALTNNHVMHSVEGIALFRNKPVRCVVVGRLPEKDIAVIRLLGVNTPLPVVPLGHSHDVMNGESVVVSGNPGGRGIVFTSGIVSSKKVILNAPNALIMSQLAPSRRDDFIQFDAASNRGNSGGPLVNMEGKLIGIVSALIPQEQNISFAIPVDRVRRLMKRVLDPEVVYEKSTGIRLNALADQALVTEVKPDSAAARAGLQSGDVITSAFGKPIQHSIDWILTLHRRLPAGDPLELVTKRGEQVIPVTYEADSKPALASVDVEDAKSGLAFDFFHGRYSSLPDFAKLEPARSGVAETLDLAKISDGRDDEYAITLKGFMEVPDKGLYRLTITSDDGSRLWVHGEEFIDHDGNHPASPASRLIRLEEGLHPIRIDYFESTGDQMLEVKLERFNSGPSEKRVVNFFHQN